MGAVLNSRSEYNRCYIPRLRMVEEEESTEMEKQESEQAKEVKEGIRKQLVAWETGKRKIRKSNLIRKSISVKIGDRSIKTRKGGLRKGGSSPSSRIGVRRSKYVDGKNREKILDHP